ncbi:MAG: EamA family transporter [Acutalibacteraceae bacterium]|nr:EamA family transporter [Acutalibacteraceae bacterium]
MLQYIWIPLTLLCGLFKGSRELLKKKALDFNTGLEILLLYSISTFILVLPNTAKAFILDEWWIYLAIAGKTLCVFIAWICGFAALKRMPVSIYGILDLSTVIFSTAFAVLFVGEVLSFTVIIGIVLVCVGLFLLKFQPKQKDINSTQQNQMPQFRYILLAFGYTAFNSASATIDKLLLRNDTVSSTQLQYWFMVMLCAFYCLYFILRRIKVNWKTALKNYRIYIMAILLILADKANFIANSMDSSVTVMTLIKQSSCIVVIVGGRIFFKEKNLLYKLLCAVIIIVGIVISTL